jgi:hypothetical protein
MVIVESKIYLRQAHGEASRDCSGTGTALRHPNFGGVR